MMLSPRLPAGIRQAGFIAAMLFHQLFHFCGIGRCITGLIIIKIAINIPAFLIPVFTLLHPFLQRWQPVGTLVFASGAV